MHEPATMVKREKFLMSLSELSYQLLARAPFLDTVIAFSKTVRLPPTFWTLYMNGSEKLDNVDKLLKNAKGNSYNQC